MPSSSLKNVSLACRAPRIDPVGSRSAEVVDTLHRRLLPNVPALDRLEDRSRTSLSILEIMEDRSRRGLSPAEGVKSDFEAVVVDSRRKDLSISGAGRRVKHF